MSKFSAVTQKRYPRPLVAIVGIFLMGCASAHAAPPDADVWLISTRSAPRHTALEAADSHIRFWRMEQNAWVPAGREAFHDVGAPDVPTVFLIHGNRAAPNDAVQMGCSVHRYLRRARPARRFRLVIWSWPSEQVCRGVRADVQLKAHYSDVQAFYLAACLKETAAEQPVTLVGYSFGARVITGALELVAGGQVGRYRLGEPIAPRRAPWNAVLIAAALDAHWLAPGQRNGRALGQLDRALVTSNSADRVMRLYPRMYGRRRGPAALGYGGFGHWLPPADREKVRRVDVSCLVGREHGWWSYWRAGSLRTALADYALGAPEDPMQPGPRSR